MGRASPSMFPLGRRSGGSEGTILVRASDVFNTVAQKPQYAGHACGVGTRLGLKSPLYGKAIKEVGFAAGMIIPHPFPRAQTEVCCYLNINSFKTHIKSRFSSLKLL